jgi:hypothetical protein
MSPCAVSLPVCLPIKACFQTTCKLDVFKTGAGVGFVFVPWVAALTGALKTNANGWQIICPNVIALLGLVLGMDRSPSSQSCGRAPQSTESGQWVGEKWARLESSTLTLDAANHWYLPFQCFCFHVCLSVCSLLLWSFLVYLSTSFSCVRIFASILMCIYVCVSMYLSLRVCVLRSHCMYVSASVSAFSCLLLIWLCIISVCFFCLISCLSVWLLEFSISACLFLNSFSSCVLLSVC